MVPEQELGATAPAQPHSTVKTGTLNIVERHNMQTEKQTR